MRQCLLSFHGARELFFPLFLLSIARLLSVDNVAT